jgi:hypothetical protein
VLTSVEGVLEGFGWPFEVRGGSGFADRDVDAADLCLVDALEIDQLPPVIDNGNGHVPLVFFASVAEAAAAFLASSSERLFFCRGSPDPVPASNSASTTVITGTENAFPLMVIPSLPDSHNILFDAGWR